MYALFVSFYRAILIGNWYSFTWTEVSTDMKNIYDDLVTILINALGGNFTELQTFSLNTSPHLIVTHILAIITCIMVCAVVWKLTKAVFSIFFSRA